MYALLALLELFGGAKGLAETTAAERAASARVNFILLLVFFFSIFYSERMNES